MIPTTPVIDFLRLTTGDLPMLHEWLCRPHVAEWWAPTPSLDEVEEEFLPCIAGVAPVRCWLALDGRARIGFIQDYTPAHCHDDGWWLDEHDPAVRGIDQFLANGDQLGRGLGTAMVRAFCGRLFADPRVTRIQTDPSPRNGRAIRCYEKAGFRAVREVVTPDGPALLMYRDRDREA